MEERLAGGGGTADDVGRAQRIRSEPGARAWSPAARQRSIRRATRPRSRATTVNPLERPYGAQRLHVAGRLRATAEHQQPARVRGGQMTHGESRHGGGAQAGEGAAVDERGGGECLGIEQDIDPLDARQPAPGVARRDARELHPQGIRRARRHHEQLAAACGQGRARRVLLGVEPLPKRGLQGVDGPSRGEQAGHGPGIEKGWPAHGSRNPVSSGSCGSSTKRCSPVRKALPSTSVTTAGRPSACTRSHHAAIEHGAHDRFVAQRLTGRQRSLLCQQRKAGRGARAAGRAVDLAVGEHRDVALVEPSGPRPRSSYSIVP